MNASQLMWEGGKKKRRQGKEKKGDQKEEWSWELVQKSNFRILEAAT